jgi:diguanylate cyclase (GGDEF)-like protein/PAS domain S-box-containing protein
MKDSYFSDDAAELRPSARVLRFALVTLMAGATLVMAVLHQTVAEPGVRYAGPLLTILLALVCWCLLSLGRDRIAMRSLAVGLWFVTLSIAVWGGGLRNPILAAFPVIIVLVGWLFGARSTLLVGGITGLALCGLWWAEAAGVLPDAPVRDIALYAVVQVLLTVMAVFLINFLVRTYSLHLQRLRNLSDALAASHKLLQSIVDTAPVRVFWKDRDLRYMGCNPAFAKDAGLGNPADLVGKFDTDMGWHNHAKDYTDDDRKVMDSGVPKFSYDEQQTTPDGRHIWLRTSKVPLRNAADDIIGVLGIYEDITHRKHTELALQDSEARARDLANTLRMLCDNVPDLIWAKDLNYRYIFANKAMCEQLLCATDTDEPIGKDDMFFATRERAAHPDDPHWHTFGELCRDSDPITLQNGKVTQFDEFGNVRGQFLFLDVRKAPFVNDQGVVLGVVGSGRNVTQQKVVEERLKLASLVLEHSSEALMITDANDVIVEVNPAFTTVTGYGRDEALGATPRLLRSGQHGVDFYRQMWSAINTDGQWQGEIVNRSKDGELFTEWLTISTLNADDGTVHRRVALFSNVTEKKKRDELIWKQANFDMLTELPNRRMFHDRLRQEMLKTQRSGLKLVLLFLDLDRFKEVNDTLGHDKGDVLLTQVAGRIVGCVRESDTVARLGGDEFTVILTAIDNMSSVERIAQDLIGSLSRPFEIGEDIAHISASVGIAVYPTDTTDAAELLHMADQAMYRAKGTGRSRYVHYAAMPGQASA